DPWLWSPPIVAGSWYQRPHPYHFDYFRNRWGGGLQRMADGAHAHWPPDCPCAAPPPLELVE
ncbi:MAG TPA: hypothetical protein PJ982_20220, partial [Lacipirellulaceae bacterium]|nr:hypothetical protein [Lacipirellulaceae bacterium]